MENEVTEGGNRPIEGEANPGTYIWGFEQNPTNMIYGEVCADESVIEVPRALECKELRCEA